MRTLDADALKIKLKERKSNFTKGWEQKDRIPKQELARVDEISLLINIIDDLTKDNQDSNKMTELEEHFYHRCGFLQGIEYGKELTCPTCEWENDEEGRNHEHRY